MKISQDSITVTQQLTVFDRLSSTVNYSSICDKHIKCNTNLFILQTRLTSDYYVTLDNEPTCVYSWKTYILRAGNFLNCRTRQNRAMRMAQTSTAGRPWSRNGERFTKTIELQVFNRIAILASEAAIGITCRVCSVGL